MELDGFDNCNICMETFDEKLRPRCLPCGHTICSCCIDNAVEIGRLTCPLCKKQHPASSSNDFPINYTAESLISKLKNEQHEILSTVIPDKDPRSVQSRSLRGKIDVAYTDQLESLRSLVQDSKELESDVSEYNDYLLEREILHRDLTAKISHMLQQNEDMIKQIDDEKKKVTDLLKEGEQHQTTANDSLLKYGSVTAIPDKVAASDDVEIIFDTLSSWNKKCKSHLPCSDTIIRSRKIVRDTMAALTFANTEKDEDNAGTDDLLESCVSIMEKTNKLCYQLRDLQTMSVSAQHLLENGFYFAVQKKDGCVRTAKMTFSNGKTYLHYLQDAEPPANAITVQHKDLIQTLNTDSVTAFMDLAWKGSLRGRIHILLSPDTPLARHFRILCGGDLGPSYANSRFLRVINKSNYYNELVELGDYENDNGIGGAPLFTGLNVDDEVYKRNFSPGAIQVSYVINDGSMISQFRIITGNCSGTNRGVGIFGKVTDGLDVVKEAAKLDDIRQVAIQDCGMILPL